MTTIINAVSGTGLTQSADGSGIVKLQSNGVTTNALAWVNTTWNGTTLSIAASYNVSSVTRTAAGAFTVAFNNALNDANYAVTGSAMISTSYSGFILAEDNRLGTRSNASCYVAVVTPSLNYGDAARLSISIFGN